MAPRRFRNYPGSFPKDFNRRTHFFVADGHEFVHHLSTNGVSEFADLLDRGTVTEHVQ